MPGSQRGRKSPDSQLSRHSPVRNRRSRSRSKTPVSRRRSYDDYSDSFYSDDSRSRSPPRRIENRAKTNGTRANKVSQFQAVYRNAKPSRRGGRGGARGGARTASTTAGSPKTGDETARRVLSARRNKINDLKNESEDLQRRLSAAEAENKTLRRERHLREKALKKYESDENNITQMVSTHNAEVRSLRELLRKSREKSTATERHLQDAEDELERMKKQNARLKALVDDKQLGERSELARKVTKAEADLEDTERRVKKLEVHITNLEKNHKHQMGIERHRQKDTQKKLDDMTEKYEKLLESMREKEKQLEVQNIYAARLAVSKHNSVSNTSLGPTPQPAYTRHRKNSEPSLTPRDKAKLFEQKRRDDEKKNREERDRREAAIRQRRDIEDRQRKEEEETKEREQRKLEDEERQERERRERLERDRIDRDERDKRRKTEEEQRKKRQEEEEDRRVLEELEKRKKEAEAMFKKQSQAESEREEKQRQDREEAERRARERQEEERRVKERQEAVRREREEFEQSQEEVERRQQKDSLLAKLKAIDDSKTASEASSDLFNLPRDRTVTKSKKDYQFSEPIENLYHGKPSHEKVTVPVLENHRRKRGGLFDDSTAYNPSFGSSTVTTHPTKPMSLFDNSPAQSASKTRAKRDSFEDIFGASDSPSTVKKPEALNLHFQTAQNSRIPSTGTTTTSVFNHSNLFTDTSANGNSGLLPRRPKQPITTFSNRPTINAVDDLDDDIEEVIL